MNRVESPMSFPSLRLSWSIWSLGALFYLIGFFQRVAPGVMTRELSEEFALNAAALGNLSAFYFYSYVAMQVPTGLLADRWGPRKLLTLGALVAAMGGLLFALAPNLLWASAGRLLVGASVAVAFVALLKLAAHWIPHNRYALASGLALCIGVSGAVFAGVPLRLLIGQFGWRPVMLSASIVTLVIAVLIWLYVRNDPSEKGYKSYFSGDHVTGSAGTSLWSSIRKSFSYSNIALLFFVPGGIVGAILAFAGLWGVPFLTTHYNMAQTHAAGYCSLMLIAWAAGGPVIGWLSDRMGKRKQIYVIACLSLIALWWLLLMQGTWSTTMLVVLMVLIGLFSGAIVLSFAYARESAPSHLTGTVSGLINMGVMLGPMVMQPAVGIVLDKYWVGEMVSNTRIYSLQTYQYAFSLFFIWLCISTLFISLSKETYCKPFK